MKAAMMTVRLLDFFGNAHNTPVLLLPTFLRIIYDENVMVATDAIIRYVIPAASIYF